MKIGRREHLKQLGLGAAGILGAGHLEDHLAANQPPTAISNLAVNGLPARDWPWTGAKPTAANPGIRLVFAGMMIFTYKRTDDRGPAGRVVFHRNPQHTLQIIVARTNPCVQTDMGNIPNGAKIDLVIPQRNYDRVTYFQTGDQDDFNRANWDDKDFRWLLDLEGPELFNNKNFDRTTGRGFNTRLNVQSGRFYTYQRTNSKFKANVGTLQNQVFHVAKVMACDIQLADAETLELRIPGKPVQTMRNPDKYEIYFLNYPCRNCPQNDFHMAFDAVEDAEAYQFHLELVPPAGANQKAPNLCRDDIGEPSRGSDEAPCMGGGFGGGRGFP